MSLLEDLKREYKELLDIHVEKYPVLFGGLKTELENNEFVIDLKYKHILNLLSLKFGIKSPYDMFNSFNN